MIQVLNLWIFFVIGYGIIWGAMILINKKRGNPIEHRELFQTKQGKVNMVTSMIHLVLFFIGSLITPINFGSLFWLGVGLTCIGVFITVLAMKSFSRFTDELNTIGIYKFSRNPMYVGGFLFILGLCLIGIGFSIGSILLWILFLVWIPLIHRTVLLEERFLEKTYGAKYIEFKNKVPRYLIC
jgi:protein-S-isoprenylcysteine O-methyltransferase Ste14